MFHGVKKKDVKKITPEEEKKNQELFKKVQVIMQEIYKIREEEKYSQKSMDLLFKAATVMPDSSTIWDVRKILILNHLKTLSDDEAFKFLVDEVSLTLKILKKNKKSYLLWFHRVWTIEQIIEYEKKKNIPFSESALNNEVKLIDAFLQRDDRNFHVWNYRVNILSLISKYYNNKLKEFVQLEIEITLKIIKYNFSNFSAWHYRAKMIPIYFFQNGIKWNTEKALEYFKEDLTLLKQAFYTDPKDQSPWNYHYWLITNFSPIFVKNVKLSEDKKTITIQYSNVFKTKNVINIEGSGEILNEKEFSDSVEIKIEKIDKEIIVKNKVIDDIVLNFDNLSLITNKICFTKENLNLPTIKIFKEGEEVKYEIKMTNTPEFQIKFLNEQIEMIKELIEKSTSIFIEGAHFRLSQIYHIFYQINRVSSETAEAAKEYKEKELNELKILKEKSKRMTSYYSTILESLQ